MAIAETTVWELRSGGNNNNGGGFNSEAAGTDRSQSDTPFANGTNLTVDGTTNTDVAPDGYTPVSADVGNIIQITAGGGWTVGFYEILSIASGKWRLDRSPAATSTASGTWALGGGLATFQKVGDNVAQGHTVFVQYGTFSISTTFSYAKAGASGKEINWVGYDSDRSLRTTDTNRPLLTTATNSLKLFTTNGVQSTNFRNIAFSNTAGTRDYLITNATSGSSTSWIRCLFDGFVTLNPYSTTAANNHYLTLRYCEVKNCTSGAISIAPSGSFDAFGTWFHDMPYAVTHGNSAGTMTLVGCVFSNITNEGLSISRTTTSQPNIVVRFCTFFNCGYGIRLWGNSGIFPSTAWIEGNVFYGGGYGIYQANLPQKSITIYSQNAYGGQSSAARYNIQESAREITLTANPFVNSAVDDYRLNNTAGGGALLRGVGYAYTFGFADYRDIGAIQHQDSGGGSATVAHAYVG